MSPEKFGDSFFLEVLGVKITYNCKVTLPKPGTIGNSSEIHPETFVLCAIASLRLCVIVFQFNAKAQRRRDAKSVVNLGLHVFRVVVHPTDHYGNHWISRPCPLLPSNRSDRRSNSFFRPMKFIYYVVVYLKVYNCIGKGFYQICQCGELLSGFDRFCVMSARCTTT